jgi:hypothetical protein
MHTRSTRQRPHLFLALALLSWARKKKVDPLSSFAWYFMQTNDAAKFVWYQFKLCQLKSYFISLTFLASDRSLSVVSRTA